MAGAGVEGSVGDFGSPIPNSLRSSRNSDISAFCCSLPGDSDLCPPFLPLLLAGAPATEREGEGEGERGRGEGEGEGGGGGGGGGEGELVMAALLATHQF